MEFTEKNKKTQTNLSGNNPLRGLYDLRASRLAEYAHQLGQDIRLAKLLGFSPARLHRLIRKRDVPFTEKIARAIEEKLDKPLGWLDTSQDSQEPNRNLVPVYLIEDIEDLQNAKPSSQYQYITNIYQPIFVQVLSSSYEPLIQPGSKVLIDQNHSAPEIGNTYLIAYSIQNVLTKPVFRKYTNKGFVNTVTNETESIPDYKIYGKCELIVNTNL